MNDNLEKLRNLITKMLELNTIATNINRLNFTNEINYKEVLNECIIMCKMNPLPEMIE
jgi:hypothetical protein